MTWRLLRTILALPTPVIVVVPALLVWASAGTTLAVRPAGPTANKASVPGSGTGTGADPNSVGVTVRKCPSFAMSRLPGPG